MLITLGEHRIRELTRKQGTQAEYQEGRACPKPLRQSWGRFTSLTFISIEISLGDETRWNRLTPE